MESLHKILYFGSSKEMNNKKKVNEVFFARGIGMRPRELRKQEGSRRKKYQKKVSITKKNVREVQERNQK